jgi:hypothetical protein
MGGFLIDGCSNVVVDSDTVVAVVAVVAVVVVVDDAVGLVVPRRTLTVTTAGLGVLPGPVMRNQGTSSVYGPPGWRTLTLEPLTVM